MNSDMAHVHLRIIEVLDMLYSALPTGNSKFDGRHSTVDSLMLKIKDCNQPDDNYEDLCEDLMDTLEQLFDSESEYMMQQEKVMSSDHTFAHVQLIESIRALEQHVMNEGITINEFVDQVEWNIVNHVRHFDTEIIS
jgi:hemerythrin